LFENLECFSTIAYQMEKHIQNWMKKLEQSRGINILQTINSLHRKSLCIGIKPFDKACQLLHTHMAYVSVYYKTWASCNATTTPVRPKPLIGDTDLDHKQLIALTARP
jgi:hypothetical protein